MGGSIHYPQQPTLIEFSLPQTFKQVIHRLQQRPSVAVHTTNCVAVHGGQRRLLITLEELAHTDNYVERRAQLVTHRLCEIIAIALTGYKIFVNAGLFMWGIYCGLHSLRSRHESTLKGSGLVRPPVLPSTHQFMCPTGATHIF